MEIHAGSSLRGRGARLRNHLHHLFDGGYAGQSLFGEGEGECDGAHELAVHIHWAPTHPGNDAGLIQRPAGKPRQNDVVLGRDGVLQHPQKLNLELLDPVALKDGLPDTFEARLNLTEREELNVVLAPQRKQLIGSYHF